MRSAFTLVRRKISRPAPHFVYYYRLGSDPTRKLRSTGQTSRALAETWVRRLLDRPRGGTVTLGDYQRPFWGPDCPRCRRKADEGREVTARYARQQRQLLDAYLVPDPLCRRPMGEISRGDLIAYRGRLRDRLGEHVNTINKVLAAVKTIFREALLREDIDRDPTAGVGLVRETRIIRGVFSRDELLSLFAECPGPWGDREAFTAFDLAAVTGMRRGEVLALRWRALDLRAGLVHVEEAWKGKDVIGRPKSGKVRTAPLTDRAVAFIRDWFDESARCAPDDFVFCDGAGRMRGETWWTKHFRQAMLEAGIDARARRISAHSFRHSLNSHLRASGMDPAKIRAAMGWAGERIQDEYTHWDAEHLREQAREIERLGL